MGSLGLVDVTNLLRLESISTETLLCSAGNYVQAGVMQHDGG